MISQNSPGQYQLKLPKRNLLISGKLILLAIIILAVVLRLASAIYQRNTITDLPGIFDQISYDGLARRLIDGHGFSFAEGHWPATRAGEPTAHWSYLYTLYLTIVYILFGAKPLVARIIQAILVGVLQPFFTWRIARRIFGEGIGLVAAAFSAVYIYFFYYAGGLITESFYIVGVLWVIDIAFRITDAKNTNSRENSILPWLELGLAIGLTVLLRQVYLMFLPFLYLWIVFVATQPADRLPIIARFKRLFTWPLVRGVSVSIIILVLLIIPWTLRNYSAFHKFVLLNTNAGFAFFWGNHPIYGTSFIPLLPGDTYYTLIPDELKSLSEAEIDSALLKLGLQFVFDDPGRIFLLSLTRAREFFKFWPSADSSLISNISRVGSFGIALPFILYGIWVTITSTLKTAGFTQKSRLFLLFIFIVVYTGIHLVSWALIRYRLPVDAVFLIFAAFGLVKIANKLKITAKIVEHV